MSRLGHMIGLSAVDAKNGATKIWEVEKARLCVYYSLILISLLIISTFLMIAKFVMLQKIFLESNIKKSMLLSCGLNFNYLGNLGII